MRKQLLALLTLIGCLLTTPAHAAFTVHNSIQGYAGTATGTFNINISAGHSVAVFVMSNHSTAGSVTDSGSNVYTNGAANGGSWWAYFNDLPGAITSVSVTPGYETGEMRVVVFDISATGEISYVDSDTLIYNFNSVTTTDGTTTEAFTPTGTDALVLGVARNASGADAIALGTGFSAPSGTGAGSGGYVGEYRAVSSAAAATFTASVESAFIVVGGIMFEVAEEEEDIVATKLIFGSQPGNVVVGETFGAFTVRAVDESDALDEDFEDDVTVALETGNGELAGTLTETAVAGIATFDDVHIDTLNVDAVIEATADGLTAANSDEFDVTAGTGTDGTAGFPSSSRLGGVLQ
jgi:hypothetical protein